jgi:hypothetical protein
MSLEQYRTHCILFGVRSNIRNLSVSHKIKGICRSIQVVGTAVIPVPFPELDVVLDVEFKMIRENGLNLLSLKDMKGAKFQLDIQRSEL